MSKKEKMPSTPESRAQKLARKAEKKQIFGKTFETAFAIFLSFVLVYSVCYISFHPAATVVSGAPVSNNSGNSSGSGSSGNSGSSSGGASANNEQTTAAANQGSDENDNDSNSDDNQQDASALSASSSVADVVSYFNTAINKVKPSAKQITLLSETNSEAGGISGNLPSTLTSLANSLISSNMGTKDLSTLDAEAVNATSTEAKNAMFPVERETWSSQLTADDIASHSVKDNGSSYEITLNIKEDAPSADTVHGYGHNGKVFSVVMPTIITDNAGAAAGLIKNIKTGHKDGRVTVTVDKASGNVTHANYYFVWTLELSVFTANISIPFGLEKDYDIAW